jgi:hypothetical protein
MTLQHRLGPDADFVDHARAQILDQDVGGLAKPVQLIHVRRELEVEHDRALVAVLAVEIERGDAVRSIGRAPDAGVVAAVRLLDLDHVGAHVGHDHAGQRSGQRLAHFDDANSLERQHDDATLQPMSQNVPTGWDMFDVGKIRLSGQMSRFLRHASAGTEGNAHKFYTTESGSF